jgi:hypothetical protein
VPLQLCVLAPSPSTAAADSPRRPPGNLLRAPPPWCPGTSSAANGRSSVCARLHLLHLPMLRRTDRHRARRSATSTRVVRPWAPREGKGWKREAKLRGSGRSDIFQLRLPRCYGERDFKVLLLRSGFFVVFVTGFTKNGSGSRRRSRNKRTRTLCSPRPGAAASIHVWRRAPAPSYSAFYSSPSLPKGLFKLSSTRTAAQSLRRNLLRLHRATRVMRVPTVSCAHGGIQRSHVRSSGWDPCSNLQIKCDLPPHL